MASCVMGNARALSGGVKVVQLEHEMMRLVKVIGRSTVVLGLVLVFMAANSGIAFGKGPESVTLTGPGAETPLELMPSAVKWPISCAEPCPTHPLVRLMEQSGLWTATGDLPVAIDEPGRHQLGTHHVLTWIRMGPPGEPVEVRTIYQFLYLDAVGGPVIHTPPDQTGLQGWGEVPAWSRASSEMPTTLTALGAGPLSGDGGTIESATADPAVGGDAGAVEPAVGSPADENSVSGVGWTAAAAAVVVALTWVIRRRSAPLESDPIVP